MVSSWIVNFGGVFVTPRKENFGKIVQTDIVNMMDRLSVNQNFFTILMDNIKIKIKRDLNHWL